jgi:hypothetical protein
MSYYQFSNADISDVNEFFLCRGLEKLFPLGGFIEDVAKESILDCFGETIAAYAEEYNCFGDGMWNILLDAHQIYLSRTNEDGTGVDDPEDEDVSRGSQFNMARFAKWEAGQNIRCGMWIQKEGHFCKDWKLSKKMKRALDGLSPVQERLMYLSLGMDTGIMRDTAMLAAMPEFRCNKLYILKEFKETGDAIKRITGNNISELKKLFLEQRRKTRMEKEVSE